MDPIRRVILVLALSGVFAGIFWDTLFEHVHGTGNSEEDCPFLTGVGSQGPKDIDDAVAAAAHGKFFPEQLESVGDKGFDISDEEKVLQLPSITQEDLASYNGIDKTLPILMGIENVAIDVTESAEKYGKGNRYNPLAGRIATRAIALNSLEENDLTNDFSDFTEEQMELKNRWVSFFLSKYPVVYRIEGL